MPGWEKLQDFVARCVKRITGDEKGQAQIFLDCRAQGFGSLVRWLRVNTPLTVHGRCVIKTSTPEQ